MRKRTTTTRNGNQGVLERLSKERMGRSAPAGRKPAMGKEKAKPKLGTFVGRSGLEARAGALLKANGVGFGYESRRIPYVLHKEYVTDFELDRGIIIETKGRFTSEDRTKMRTVLHDNPDLNLFMVFSKPNNTLTKRSKTTYGDWCDKQGIPWLSIEDFEKLIKEHKENYVDKLLERKGRMEHEGNNRRRKGSPARKRD